MSLKLRTDAILADGFLDPRYTCDLDNSSPELRWEHTPRDTTSFALVAEDLDAHSGVFAHWVIFNIPASISHLPAGIPPQEMLPNGISQGVNDFGRLGYGGPCPPTQDGAHRYIFRLYALRVEPQIPVRASREQLLAAIMPYVLETTEIMCRYARSEAEQTGRRAG